MAPPRSNDPIVWMDLATMRANGVRSLDIQCNQCRHEVILERGQPAICRCRRSGRRWSAPSAGRSAPMSDLGRHYGLFTDKHEHKVTVSLELVIAQSYGAAE
jgi:hypothetical protein